MGCKNCGHGGGSTPHGAIHAAHIQTPETTEVRSWTMLPILDITNVPDDLDLIGGSNSEYQSWRVPAKLFMPGGSLNRIQYTVSKGASDVTIPSGQIVPVFIGSAISSWAAAKAVSGQTATDIAIATDDDEGTITLMKSGYFTFPRPHMYEVGKTYYLSQTNSGEVISAKPSAGIVQPLFSVVDQLTISINVALV